MSLDNDLDRIAIYISKLDPHDSFKEALENEYRLYRDILESVPVDVNPPDRLPNSIYSLLLRLKNYVVFGISNNPLVPVAHSIVKPITLEEKDELLREVKTNSSFVSTRKQKNEILKGYLNNINYDGSIDEIRSTIFLVVSEYRKCNIYCNDLEQEIAKAKYFYIIRLISDGLYDEAESAIQDYDSDMLLFVHIHHKDTVNSLLRKGKANLASELYLFLNEYEENKINDIEFWKVLAQIEKPDLELKEESKDDEEEKTEIVIKEFEEEPKKKRRFVNLFKKESFERETFSITVLPNDYVRITLKLFPSFNMVEKEYKKLKAYLDKINHFFGRDFNEVLIKVENYQKPNSFNLNNPVHINRILKEIFNHFNNNVVSYKKILDLSSYSFGQTIPEECFEDTGIKTVILPECLREIGKKAFYNCELLKEVIISPKSFIRYIGDEAFKCCRALESFDLSSTNLDKEKGLGRECFFGCYNLKEVELGYYVEAIPDGCFYDCSSLSTINIKCIEEVGEEAFYNCTRLERVEDTTLLRKIRKKAFFGCKNLKFFSFPMVCGEDEELLIEDSAFEEAGLKKIYIDAEKLILGEKVFRESRVVKVTIYSSINSIPYETFYMCNELEEIRLPDYLESIDEKCFFDCTSLKKIKLPKTLKRIGRECFKGCYSLKEINVPEKFEILGNDAFDDCVSLPKSIIDQFNQK